MRGVDGEDEITPVGGASPVASAPIGEEVASSVACDAGCEARKRQLKELAAKARAVKLNSAQKSRLKKIAADI